VRALRSQKVVNRMIEEAEDWNEDDWDEEDWDEEAEEE
jgi:hypothetical protein